MLEKENMKIIVCGGGTGGHVFPAIAIANALKAANTNIEFLFVGAQGRLEMEKVPAAGYKIIGLPIAGFQREITVKNFVTIWKLMRSIFIARKIIKSFKPDVVVGVGGYASGPVMYMASRQNIPTVIQEQNSFPGVTNKLLAKKAAKICVAYQNVKNYFPEEKIVYTGNPVRENLLELNENKEEAAEYFGANPAKKIVLVIGGSLGAKSLNDAILNNLNKIEELNNIRFIVQTGKRYFNAVNTKAQAINVKNTIVTDFISRMDLAYSLADVIISRAGAIAISELCIIGKPVILIPSPNVAEDHQTKNALELVNSNAALLVHDNRTIEEMVDQAVSLITNEELKTKLKTNIKKLAKPDSAEEIAEVILGIVKRKNC